MAKPHDYFLQVINKGFDEDGAYGVQCVDGFKHFCRTVLGFNISKKSICSPTGYAHSIWDNYKSLGLDKYFDKVASNQLVDGDWVIWAKGSAPCPSSHVAMFRKDNGNGTGIFLGQNQTTSRVYTQVNISYSGIRGGLRPKIYHQVEEVKEEPKIKYRAHVQDDGWQDWVADGKTAGTTGKSKRLEAIQINYKGDVYAKAHLQDDGWVDYGKITKDTVIGTTGESRRLEDLCLKGNFKFRVHLQDDGWTAWTDADGIATLGTVGQSKRIEAIEIKAK